MLGKRDGGWARRASIGWAALAAALVAAGCGSSSGDEPAQRTSTTPATAAEAPARTATTPRTTATDRTKPTAKAEAKAEADAKAKAKATETATTPRSAAPDKKATAQPRTTTTTTTTTTAPAKKLPATRTKLGKPQVFSGDGDRTIGTLAFERNVVVRWTVAGGGEFTVTDGAGKLKIAGSGPSGQSFAGSGDYRSVKVTAGGRWTLSFASLGA